MKVHWLTLPSVAIWHQKLCCSSSDMVGLASGRAFVLGLKLFPMTKGAVFASIYLSGIVIIVVIVVVVVVVGDDDNDAIDSTVMTTTTTVTTTNIISSITSTTMMTTTNSTTTTTSGWMYQSVSHSSYACLSTSVCMEWDRRICRRCANRSRLWLAIVTCVQLSMVILPYLATD